MTLSELIMRMSAGTMSLRCISMTSPLTRCLPEIVLRFESRKTVTSSGIWWPKIRFHSDLVNFWRFIVKPPENSNANLRFGRSNLFFPATRRMFLATRSCIPDSRLVFSFAHSASKEMICSLVMVVTVKGASRLYFFEGFSILFQHKIFSSPFVIFSWFWPFPILLVYLCALISRKNSNRLNETVSTLHSSVSFIVSRELVSLGNSHNGSYQITITMESHRSTDYRIILHMTNHH